MIREQISSSLDFYSASQNRTIWPPEQIDLRISWMTSMYIGWIIKESTIRCVASLAIELCKAHQNVHTRQHFGGPVVFPS